MNTYTLDPPKTEATVASAPTSTLPFATAPTFTYVPALPSTTAPVPVLASNYAPPTYQHHPQQHPQPSNVQPDTRKIRDWLAWSIISLFVGGIIPGFLPLVFTLICRSNKKYNEINSARKMSNLALVFNIIITIMGLAVLIGLFVYLFVFTQTFKFED